MALNHRHSTPQYTLNACGDTFLGNFMRPAMLMSSSAVCVAALNLSVDSTQTLERNMIWQRMRGDKKQRNRTTIFHARIVRIGRQEPTEYDNRLMCSARRRRERIKLEFVWKMKKKNKQTRIYCRFSWIHPFIFRYVLFGDVWRAQLGHTAYDDAHCQGGETNSWEKSEMLFCLLRQNSAYFWTRRKGAKKIIWGICQSKESVRAAKYHRSWWAYQMFSMSTLWLIEAFFKNKKKWFRYISQPRTLEFHVNVPIAHISTSAKRSVQCQTITKLIKTTKATLLFQRSISSRRNLPADVESSISNFSFAFISIRRWSISWHRIYTVDSSAGMHSIHRR